MAFKNTNSIGISLGLLSCLGYVMMNTFSKISLGSLEISFLAYYFLINSIAVFILSIYIFYQYIIYKINLIKFRTYYIFAAAFCSLGSFIASFLALNNISLDIFYSILFSSPIFSTIISYFFLRETIDKHKIIALTLGSVGIMIVINPFNIQATNVSMISIILTFVVVILDVFLGIISKKYLQNEKPITIRYYIFIISSFISTIFIFSSNKIDIFTNISLEGYITTFSASVFMIAGSLLLLKAYKYSQASIISSTYYSYMIWAIIIGIIIFNEIPTWTTLIGCALIIISNCIPYFNKNISK